MSNVITATEYCFSVFDGTHDSPKQSQIGYPLITSKHLSNNSLDIKNAYLISEFDYKDINKRSKVSQWDILFSMIGTVGEVYLEKNNDVCYAIKNIGVFSCKDEDRAKWLYYYLKSPIAKKHIKRYLNGAVQKFLPLSALREFPVLDFNQNSKLLTRLISFLDEKIIINNRINAELEAMAKTLYDYWFVQFDFPNEEGKPYKSSGGKMVYNNILKREIPEGWEIGTISEFIASSKGGDWGKETIEGKYTMPVICVRGADINGLNGSGQIGAPKRYILDKNKEKFLLPYDLVIEISGGSPTQSTGRLLLITDEMLSRFDEPLICSNFCKAISLVNHQYAYNFKYMWDSIYDSGVLFGWEGKTSGIKNLLFESFVSKYIICMPAVELVNKFFSLAEDIHKKKQNNLKENEKIIQLRDFLLPMLMNGQVTVK